MGRLRLREQTGRGSRGRFGNGKLDIATTRAFLCHGRAIKLGGESLG